MARFYLLLGKATWVSSITHQASPLNDVNAHDERLHLRALGTAQFALGMGTEHGAITQRETIGRAKGCASSHH